MKTERTMTGKIVAAICIALIVLFFGGARADTNSFYLDLGRTNGAWRFLLTPTTSNAQYQLLGRGDMALGAWIVEADLLGNTNGTQTVHTIGNEGWNQRFFLAGSGADSDGDGLSDIYEIAVTKTSPTSADTGGTGVSDGYRDADGDGQTALQEYANRLDPFQFTTPAAPDNFLVTQAPGQNALLRWMSAYGAVNGYVIQRKAQDAAESAWVTVVSLTNVSATSYIDTNQPPLTNAVYRMWATYTNGQSSLATKVASINQGAGIMQADTSVVRGKAGKIQLVLNGKPAGISTVRLTRIAEPVAYPFLELNPAGPSPARITWTPTTPEASLDVPVASFSNGVFELPDAFVPDYFRYSFTSQSVMSNGYISASSSSPFSTLFENWVQYYYYGYRDETYSSRIKFPWIDPRYSSEENLKFSVKDSSPGGYEFRIHAMLEPANNLGFLSESCYCYGPPPDVDNGFISLDNLRYGYGGPSFDPFASVQWNHLFRNFVFSAGDLLANNRSDTHCWAWMYFDYSQRREAFDQKYSFSVPNHITGGITSSLAYFSLSQSGSFESLMVSPVDDIFVPTNYVTLYDFGFTSGQGAGSLDNLNRVNPLGLPLTGLRLALYDPPYSLVDIAPGQQVSLSSGHFGVYKSYAVPQFQPAGYYFSDGNQAFPGWDFQGLPGPDPFAASVGNVASLAAWARRSIVNGQTNRYAYVGQPFGNSYRISAAGVVTTNATGILSEYGEFLPTEPGRAALVTMPDLLFGTRGTAIVHCVGIRLDANHDGTMDYSLTGPDTTSANRPFVFWENNDVDRGHTVDLTDFEEDDLLISAPSIPPAERVPDSEFRGGTGTPPGFPAIPSKRDLEDYARLHFPGLSNLCAQLSPEYEVQLFWREEGFETPALRIFQAVDADGGIGYLTNETSADFQVNPFTSIHVGNAAAGEMVVLSDGARRAAGQYPSEHYIFCGAKRGSGELVLRIQYVDPFDQYPPLVEASAWVEIKDIKEMYERYTVGDVGSMEPLTNAIPAAEAPPGVNPRFRYPLVVAPGTPYVLHVHGWNMETWEKDRYAETMFKRLYWQGYQGHFGSFRWPTLVGVFSGLDTSGGFTTFNPSERQAWRSGNALRTLLINLNSKYGTNVHLAAHSLGNVVAGEALKGSGQQLVRSYMAMQGAIPAHAYDPSTPLRNLGLYDDGTPNRYAQYWTNGAPHYFYGPFAAERLANFYNADDYALAFWNVNQNLKVTSAYGFEQTGGSGVNPEKYFRRDLLSFPELLFPADTFEIFSFCTEARSFSLGAQSGIQGLFSGRESNLNAGPNAFGNLHKGHSAQFRSTLMRRNAFWNAFMVTTGLKTPL